MTALHRATQVLLLAAVVMVAGVAHGQGTKKVLVLNPDADALNAGDKSAIVEALRAEAKERPGVTLLPTPAGDLIDEMFNYECVDLDDACMTKIGKGNKADLVVYSKGTSSGGSVTIDVKLVDVATGKAAKTKKLTGASTKAALAGAPAVADLFFGAKAAATPPTPPTPPKPEKGSVTISSNIVGAEIWIGGKKTGVVPLTLKTKPGKLKVEVKKNGYETALVEIDIKAGDKGIKKVELTKVSAVVKPVTPVTPPDKTPDKIADKDKDKDKATPPAKLAPYYKQWWFWTAIGAGVVLVTTTIVAVSLSGDDPITKDGSFYMAIHPYSFERDITLTTSF